MKKNGGGNGNDGGRMSSMARAPMVGIERPKLSKRLKSSANLGKNKKIYGGKSKTGKGQTKKMKWSDSSQPGIREYLMEIGAIFKQGNENSHGTCNFYDKTQ